MLFNGERPRCLNVCLDLDGGDNGASGVVEQATSVESSVPDTPVEAPATPEYFHTITVPGDNGADDEVLNFKDQKELSDRYLQNRFRRADYTKKTQELGKQRKAYESDLEALRAKETSLTNMSNKYSEFDSMFTDVDDRQMRQIVEQVRGVTKQTSPELKEINAKLKAIEDREKADKKRADATERKNRDNETFNSRGRYLKSHYSDYDHEATMKAYEELNGASPEMAHQAILEMLHFAGKGRGSLIKPEDPSGPVRTKSSGKSVSPSGKSKTIQEARQEALKSL
jgi:hypothetical protein